MDNNKEFCPFCHANLQGAPIPEKYKDSYGGSTHFSRKIGITDIELDRIIKWKCPDCGSEWKR